MIRNAKEKLSDYFSVIPKTIFVFILILLCATIVIFNVRKTITISIDGEKTQITTLRSEVDSIFDANGIEVGKKDKVSVNMDSKVKNGDTIYIKRAVDLKVEVDGKVLAVKSGEDNVKDMLKDEGIALGEADKISPSKESTLKNGMNVKIVRVKEEILTEKEEIDYAKVVKESSDYEQGTQKVLQKGEKGEKLISTKVQFEDGVETSREVVKEEVVKEPIKEIIALGTLGVLRPSRGVKLNYTKKIEVRATAYTADENSDGVPDPPYGGRTASGTMAKRNPGGYSTIAVDPRVIPLGTKVYVEGYGLAIAEDTGGAIKGNKIDVYVNNYAQTMQWGVRYVNVYILK